MHVTDVRVTAETDRFSSVRFLGQGDESIDVRLADAEGGGDRVARARATMTQGANFGLAVELGHPLGAGTSVGSSGEAARGPAAMCGAARHGRRLRRDD